MSDVTSEAVIQFQGLAKVFRLGFWRRRVEALRGIDLTVRRNEILGFLGPNGAGKTTTIKILLGIIYPSAGQGTILGSPLGDVRVKSRLGFLPEQPYFYEYLSGMELLDLYGRFHGLGRRERRRKSEQLLALVGLEEAADRPVRKYSKGMLQRIGMAQALLGDPEVVILDEPMSGLDPIGRKDFREIIFRLKEEGKTIFFSTHILSDAEQICDRVCIIYRGRVVETGRLDEILKPAVEMVDLQFTGLSEAGQAALAALAARLAGLRVVQKGGTTLVTAPGWEAAEAVEAAGRAQGGKLVGLSPERETLENYFLRELAEHDPAAAGAKEGRG
jgi:ABC-2 type transport system ATP-binding protein